MALGQAAVDGDGVGIGMFSLGSVATERLQFCPHACFLDYMLNVLAKAVGINLSAKLSQTRQLHRVLLPLPH